MYEDQYEAEPPLEASLKEKKFSILLKREAKYFIRLIQKTSLNNSILLLKQ
tara:strand:+ start:28171 stop:28323 length:153 start_codon:yes stop_codon:yes gene_type:complete